MKKVVVPNKDLIPEIARLVEDGTEVTFTPKGMSMLPFIRGERDSVVLKKISEVAVGDIVLAKLSDDRYVLHRIIGVDGDKVCLMGDGNIKGTEECLKGEIMAIAVRILKGDRTIDCNSPSHRRRAELWKLLMPLRRYLLAVYRRILK